MQTKGASRCRLSSAATRAWAVLAVGPRYCCAYGFARRTLVVLSVSTHMGIGDAYFDHVPAQRGSHLRWKAVCAVPAPVWPQFPEGHRNAHARATRTRARAARAHTHAQRRACASPMRGGQGRSACQVCRTDSAAHHLVATGTAGDGIRAVSSASAITRPPRALRSRRVCASSPRTLRSA